jgi:phosphoribosyl 1,2-cyclic phosphodiesterase
MNSECTNLGLTVRFRGVRGSIPSPGRETARYGGNTSCIEVRCDGRLLILDAGSGIRSLGNDLQREFGEEPIQADVLISHTHWDHIQGFPFFAPAYSDQNRIRIWQSQRLTPQLASALRSQMQSLHFPVGLDQMRGLTGIDELDPESMRLGPYTIRTIALNHPGGCVGFRIETAYGSVAYFPDHEPFRKSTGNGSDLQRQYELMNFLSRTDLLILDTQYTEEEYSCHIGWGHGCLPDSVGLAAEAKVGQLSLFHHDPSHRDYQIDLMVEAARNLPMAAGLKISAAAEMETVFLPPSRVAKCMPNESGVVAEFVLSPAGVLTNPSLPR